jgi:protoporphyrinogen oxidase
LSAPKKVLIIGGGYTGLTAALRLSANKRLSVTLLESSGDLGGLAGGFQIGGTSLEKAYHHLFLTDTAILKLVRELGLQDKLMWCASSVGVFRDRRIHPFTTPGDLLRYSPCSLSGRLRTGLAALYLKHQKNWRGFARQTAHAWMSRACGRSAMDTIWRPLLKGKFDRHFDQVSMAWLWARIHIRANSRSTGGEKLGYFRGGFNVVTEALEKKLREQGVAIRTRTTAEKLLATERAAVINGEKVPFDFCLFTGSSHAFARLLAAEAALSDYTARLLRIHYLGAACVVFSSAQDLGRFYWVNINEPDAPFLVFINHTRLVGRDLYGGRNIYYLGAYLPMDGERYHLPANELAKLWLGYLPRLFPEFDIGQVSEQHVFRFSAAQHIVDTDYEAKIPASQTPLPGVFLSNFSQIFPEDRGTNFAVREGEKIAALILKEAAAEAAN